MVLNTVKEHMICFNSSNLHALCALLCIQVPCCARPRELCQRKGAGIAVFAKQKRSAVEANRKMF
jgi:hypothetical protein